LGLLPGMRVLDVGCGPGRHALALAARDIEVVGVDISQTFIDLARANDTTARFERADARDLRFRDEFDAVISLCQGGFGLSGGVPGAPVDDDLRILRGMARAAKPGGVVAVSAFSAYFRVRYLDETVDFDAERGAYHEVMELRDLAGARVEKDGWTTCFTPRELRLMFAAAGLVIEAQASVSPGDYARRPPDLDHYEYFTVGRKPLL
jgi:SAM-dependent methyltransferase